MSATVRYTQIKSGNGSDKSQLATLESLSLRKIGQTAEKADTPQLQGMLHKVRHLVRIESQ